MGLGPVEPLVGGAGVFAGGDEVFAGGGGFFAGGGGFFAGGLGGGGGGFLAGGGGFFFVGGTDILCSSVRLNIRRVGIHTAQRGWTNGWIAGAYGSSGLDE